MPGRPAVPDARAETSLTDPCADPYDVPDTAWLSTGVDVAAPVPGLDGWRGYVTRTSRQLVLHAFGPGIPICDVRPTASQLVEGVLRWIDTTPALATFDRAHFALRSTARAAQRQSVTLVQTSQQRLVAGSRLIAVVDRGGHLVAISARLLVGLDGLMIPGLDEELAIARAKAAVGEEAVVSLVPPVLVILPDAREAQRAHRLTWRAHVGREMTGEAWTAYVDAIDGTVLAVLALHRDAYQGRVLADVQEPSFCEGVQAGVPITGIEVNVAGIGTTWTDASGSFWLDGDVGSTTVSAALSGQPATIINMVPPNAAISVPILPDQPVDLVFDDLNAQHDERDAYFHLARCDEILLAFDPAWPGVGPGLCAGVCALVSEEPCSASWSPAYIRFGRLGNGCANWGEIGSIVAHEYGHAVQYTIPGVQGWEGVGEGNSDIMATFAIDESVIGRGAYQHCNAGFRDCDNTLRYPEHVIGQPVHDAGRVLCGFQWDVRRNLEAELGPAGAKQVAGEVWHSGRVLLQPVTQVEQVFATFVADDDDGDLSNGTPHFAALCAAATAHGFRCPGEAIRVPDDCATIGEALTLAMPGDSVLVAEGVYAERLSLVPGVILVGGYDADFSLRNPRIHEVVIDAAGNGAPVAATGQAIDSGTVVDGLTLTGGAGVSGGGLRLEGAGLTVRDCRIAGNQTTAANSGGGVFVSGSQEVVIDGCRIETNTSQAGGGMYIGDGGRVTIRNSTIAQNHATQTHGGGIHSLADSLRLVSTVLLDNQAAQRGGGIYQEGGDLRLELCTIQGNVATEGGGGYVGEGIGDGALVLTHSILSDNAQTGFVIAGDCALTSGCNDFWGNSGGDMTGGDPGSGTIFLDPLFCDVAVDDLALQSDSPCAPAYAPPGCGQIGAHGVGCLTTALDPGGAAPAMDGDVRLRVQPNPGFGGVTFRLDPPSSSVPSSRGSSSRATLRIYNALGRLVDRLTLNGDAPVVWHPERQSASGVHFGQLDCGGRTIVVKFAILR